MINNTLFLTWLCMLMQRRVIVYMPLIIVENCNDFPREMVILTLPVAYSSLVSMYLKYFKLKIVTVCREYNVVSSRTSLIGNLLILCERKCV